MDAMLIECILKRDGGTKVDLGDLTYHFAPDSEGRHVALVADPDHIGRFLSISEGYRIPRASTSPVAQAAVSAPIGAGAVVAQVTTREPELERVSLDPVQADADADEPAPLDEKQSDGAEAESAGADATPLEAMTKEQLATVYLEKTGKKSHPATTPAKLIELIKAASAA